jgi:Flp pilus assembly protein TadG
MVILALGVSALIGMVGLVVDTGRAYSERRDLEAAAEAAAHAATYQLQTSWNGSGFGSLSDATVTAAAQTYAGYNGWSSTTGQFYKAYVYGDGNTQSQTLNSNARGVLVQLSMPQDPTFTAVLGVGRYDIFARATAMFGSATSAPAIPLAVNDDSFRGYGMPEGYQPTNNGAGFGQFNFTSVVPPGCPANDQNCYLNAMRNGGSSPFQLGTSYPTNTWDGSQLSELSAQALQDRINQRPSETCTNFMMPSPRVVFLPVVNGNMPNAPNPVVFIRFRAVFLVSISAPNGFTGCFVQVSSSIGSFDPNAVGAGYGGVTVMKLVKSPGSVQSTSVSVLMISAPNKASKPSCPAVLSDCQTATLSILTAPSAWCSATVSDPFPSTASGLAAKSADGTGKVTWTWYVDSNAGVGNWPVSISCSRAATVGRASSTFQVVPSG